MPTQPKDDLKYLEKRIVDLISQVEYHTENAERIFTQHLDDVRDEQFTNIKANSRPAKFAIEYAREFKEDGIEKILALIQASVNYKSLHAEEYDASLQNLEARLTSMEQRISSKSATITM